MTQRLIGVGVGPGDPELVTVKAVRVLREADVVLVPVLAGPDPEPGRAETVIREYVAADRIRRLEFALNDTGGVTPRRAAAWQTAAAAVAEEFARGAGTVAFGTLGDPNLYSTFSYLAQTVRDLVPGVTVETLAGITAMQDLASRAGISLAEGTEPVVLVPLNGGVAALDQALASGGAVVGYKVGAAASPDPAILRDRLHRAGRLDGAVIGARLGLAGETIAPAADFLPGTQLSPDTQPSPDAQPSPDIPYLSTLIVPVRRGARGTSLRSEPSAAGSDVHDDSATCGSPDLEPGGRTVVTAVRSGPPRCDVGAAGGGARLGKQRSAGRVFFVGAGPGAPDLLTLRGATVIAAADVVIWASSLVHPDVSSFTAVAARIGRELTIPEVAQSVMDPRTLDPRTLDPRTLDPRTRGENPRRQPVTGLALAR
jgi:precorrin-2/cobalt-factor-2 C20-methyltransferase